MTCRQLAAQQPDGLLIRVELVVSAGDEPGDEHPLKRRDVQLGLDWRLDWNLEGIRTARDGRRDPDGDHSQQQTPTRVLFLWLHRCGH